MGGVILVAPNPALDRRNPLFGHGVGVTPAVLVGVGLAAQRHQHVTVKDAGNDLAQQRQGQRQAAAFLQAGEVQRCYGDIAVPSLDQRLAQQLDVVGGTAAAARLGDKQGGMLQVILAAVQRVQKLADDQQGRVAGVVVDVLQALLRHLAAAVAQHLGLVPLAGQGGLHQAELGHGHVGDKDLMGLYHVLGKVRSHVFHTCLNLCGLLCVLPVRQTGCAGGYSPRPGW